MRLSEAFLRAHGNSSAIPATTIPTWQACRPDCGHRAMPNARCSPRRSRWMLCAAAALNSSISANSSHCRGEIESATTLPHRIFSIGARMKIGITCYPTYGGSGVVATELGIELAQRGHDVHFITYSQPFRLTTPQANIHYHEVEVSQYPLFDYPPEYLALASRLA